ncbi:hypothetical protein GCM10023324_23990 [Streptomyces youssoufiensis]
MRAYPAREKKTLTAASLRPCSHRHSTSRTPVGRVVGSTWATMPGPRRSTPEGARSSTRRMLVKPSHFRYCAAAVTTSRPVRMVTGWNAGRNTAELGAECAPVAPAAPAPPVVASRLPVSSGASATGSRTTVPHGQPSSGCGQWSLRPQE